MSATRPPTGGAGTRTAGARSAPPAVLEPVLALIERTERRLRRIRPIRTSGGVLGLEQAAWHGSAIALRDGTRLGPGDAIGELHLLNDELRRVPRDAWLSAGLRAARADLAALARWAERQPPERRPVAYHGTAILWPLARRVGFEVRGRPVTMRVRLDDWYLRGVLARWSVAGRARLRRGRGALATREVWLSAGELARLFPPETVRPNGSASR